jgi:hypothetical protein
MLLVGGLCFFANIIIIVKKLKKRQIANALVDTAINVLVIGIIGATQGELIMALICSTCVSIWLWFNPFDIDKLWEKKSVGV